MNESDLSKTKGLNKIIHNKPSLIDKDTFDFSKTKIPSSLLRNCGLSRSFINSITPTGISNRYFSCLIVYATKDEAFAELLHEYLQKKGIQSQLSAKDWKTETKNQQITTEEVVFFERVLFIQSENSQKTGWNNRDLGSIILNTHESKKDILVPLYSRICKDEFKLRTKELDLELIADLEKMSE